MSRRRWREAVTEAAVLATDAVRVHRARSVLAVIGIVIGIVTVVLVASVLANARAQVELLFRDLGTDNVFAFHLTGDPYVVASDSEAQRRPLEVAFVEPMRRLVPAALDAGAQVIVPTASQTEVLIARAGENESDTMLVEGATPSLFPIIGAEISRGRGFTDLEDRQGAHVAVIGSSLSAALYGSDSPLGRTLTLGGDTYTVVGELEKRRGGVFGENRQDNVLHLPAGTVRRRFGTPERVILYVQARPGQRDLCQRQVEALLRVLRRLPAGADNDFTLSTAEQIIATFDGISGQVALVTVGLAAVSLLIGAIGIANVMFISVTERTREIGLRMALGARRQEVLLQFLLESVFLAGVGGVAGVVTALAIGLVLGLVITGFSAVPPLWAVGAGLTGSVVVGVAAGYWPARRAAALVPVDALRYE